MEFFRKIRVWIGYIATLFFLLMLWAGYDKTVWGLNADSATTIFIWFMMLIIIGIIIPNDKDKKIVCLECKSSDIEEKIEKSNLHFKKQTAGNTPRPYKNVKSENNPLSWNETINYRCNSCNLTWNKSSEKSKICSEEEYNSFM